MHNDIALPLTHAPDAAAVRKRHLSVPRETAEDGDDVLRRLVRLVDDDDASVLDRAKERGVGVVNDPTLKGSGEHELGNGSVSV